MNCIEKKSFHLSGVFDVGEVKVEAWAPVRAPAGPRTCGTGERVRRASMEVSGRRWHMSLAEAHLQYFCCFLRE